MSRTDWIDDNEDGLEAKRSSSLATIQTLRGGKVLLWVGSEPPFGWYDLAKVGPSSSLSKTVLIYV